MNLHVIHFLIKLKSASLLRKEAFYINNNKAVVKFLILFYQYNFIQSFKSLDKFNRTLIYLKFCSNINFLKNLKIISTKSKVRYLTYFDISKILNKNIFLLFSTTAGMLTASNCKRLKSGGKLLFLC